MNSSSKPNLYCVAEILLSSPLPREGVLYMNHSVPEHPVVKIRTLLINSSTVLNSEIELMGHRVEQRILPTLFNSIIGAACYFISSLVETLPVTSDRFDVVLFSKEKSCWSR